MWKVLAFFCNLLGVLNFKPISNNTFGLNNVSLGFSICLFLALQINGLKMYKIFFWVPENNILLEVLAFSDYFAWTMVLSLTFFQKIFKRKDYLKILNQFLEVRDHFKSSSEVDIKFRNFTVVCWAGELLILILYLITKIFTMGPSLVTWLYECLYGYTLLIYLQSNVFFEIGVLKLLGFYMEHLTVNLTPTNVRTTIDCHFELLKLTRGISKLYSSVKGVQIAFLFNMLLTYSFYVYNGFFHPELLNILGLYWLLEVLLVLFSCHFWEVPSNKVS